MLDVEDEDTEQIIALLGGDLTQAHQYVAVAEAMAKLGRDEDVLAWALSGTERTSGWQTARLYDLACEAYTRRSEPLEVLALRRAQHERSPTSSTYNQLRAAAESLHTWPHERDGARRALSRDPGALVDALLAEGETELAWQTAATAAHFKVGTLNLLHISFLQK